MQTDRRVVPVVARGAVEAATEGARWVTRWQGWADWPLSLPLPARRDHRRPRRHHRLDGHGARVVRAHRDVAGTATRAAARRLGRPRPCRLLPRRVRAWREFALAVGVVLGLANPRLPVAFGRPPRRWGSSSRPSARSSSTGSRPSSSSGRSPPACSAGRGATRDWGTAPGLLGLLAAAALFSGLPGHVVQVNGPSTSVAFASLALLLGYTVLRTGTVWPAVLAHALLNLTTIATWQASGPQGLRLALAAATLVALVAGADVAGRRLGLRRRVPTVIDLSRTSAPLAS